MQGRREEAANRGFLCAAQRMACDTLVLGLKYDRYPRVTLSCAVVQTAAQI
jgi:hypothetical protein